MLRSRPAGAGAQTPSPASSATPLRRNRTNPALGQPGAVFATLTQDGESRGLHRLAGKRIARLTPTCARTPWRRALRDRACAVGGR
ncbi:MAG: hypothetical protein IPJ52_00860 [Rhodocyclaceae bacterium]|nr:hypothetical protein [Rhodocyclaceae bacterium]